MIVLEDFQFEVDRRKAQIAQAEKDYPINQALKSSSVKSYQRWLARLGARLVTWGHSLQARYDRTLPVSNTLQRQGNANA